MGSKRGQNGVKMTPFWTHFSYKRGPWTPKRGVFGGQKGVQNDPILGPPWIQGVPPLGLLGEGKWPSGGQKGVKKGGPKWGQKGVFLGSKNTPFWGHFDPFLTPF